MTTETLDRLTDRQREVLALVARGHSNSEIAAILGISLDGVKWHVSEIIGRLGVENRTEAADLWREWNGLVPRVRRRASTWLTLGGLRWAGLGVIAAAAILALTALAWQAREGGSAVPAGNTPEATPTAAAIALPQCDPATIDLALAVSETAGGTVTVSLDATAPVPCSLATTITPSIRNDEGTLSPVERVGRSVGVELSLPGSAGSFVWVNECQFEGEFEVAVALGTTVATAHIAGPPDCIGPALPSSLQRVRPGQAFDAGALAAAIEQQLEACETDTIDLSTAPRYVAEYVEVTLHASAPEPCRLTGLIRATVVGAGGEPIGVEYSGIQTAVDLFLPPEARIAGFNWLNRCGARGARFQFEFEGTLLLEVPVAELDCESENPNRLGHLGAGGPGQPNRPPIPERVDLPPGLALYDIAESKSTVTVAAYEGSPSSAPSCSELHLWIMPASAAGTVEETTATCEIGDRLSFLQDHATGHLYLYRVNILLETTLGLPHGRGSSECSSIEEWMIPATDDSDAVAAWITTCDAGPTLRGETPPGGRQIWVNVLDGSALLDVAPETPCWQLGAHLGGPSGARSTPVVCTFYP